MPWTVFRTIDNYYLYDRYTNTVSEIPEKDYKKFTSGDSDLYPIEKYQKLGLLQDCMDEKMEHPFSQVMGSYLEERMEQLVLQVTRSCNLRCEYCSYTETSGYNGRNHENKFMSYEMAKRGIDFLMAHSRRIPRVIVGFYGGEPLLAFELIKKVTEYIETAYPSKRVVYSITTNGTLLTDEVVDYLVEKNVGLMVSLDGPEELHNKHRVFADGKGSYQIIMDNLKNIYRRYPDYYKNIKINSVLTPDKDIKCMEDFLYASDYLSNISSQLSFLTDAGLDSKDRAIYDESVFIAQNVCQIYQLLVAVGELEYNPTFRLFGNYIDQISRVANVLARGALNHKSGHPGGPCLAGSKRTFMDIYGKFYPCEKVSEIAEVQIGSIEGFDLDQINVMLNVGKMTEQTCKNCWGFHYCDQCVVSMLDSHGISPQKRIESCDGVRNLLKGRMATLMYLVENGVEFNKYY